MSDAKPVLLAAAHGRERRRRVSDGRRRGVWKLHATHGLPVEMSIMFMGMKGWTATWDQRFVAAKRDGANLPVLARWVSEAVGNAYPPAFVEGFRARLPLWIEALSSWPGPPG